MPSEIFTLTRPIGRPLHVEHEKRMRVLEPGFVYLFNHTVPYRATAVQEYHAVSVAIPGDELRSRVAITDSLCGLSIGHENQSTAGALLCSFADHLKSAADQEVETEFASLTEHFLDLIALLISRPERTPVSSESSTVLAHRARALKYIRCHLAESTLTPARIAAGCGISLSYLKTVFRGTGRGIEEHVFAERLEHARRALLDPSRSHASISTIAYTTGFNHPAHFARAFKRRFGTTPSELRARG